MVLLNPKMIGVNEINSDTNGINLDTNGTNLDTNGTNLDINGINFDTNLNSTDTERIFRLVQLNPKIRQKEITEKTGISLRTVKCIMAKLQKEGKIERKGSNRFDGWIIKK